MIDFIVTFLDFFKKWVSSARISCQKFFSIETLKNTYIRLYQTSHILCRDGHGKGRIKRMLLTVPSGRSLC